MRLKAFSLILMGPLLAAAILVRTRTPLANQKAPVSEQRARPAPVAVREAAKPRVVAGYGKLALSFEANQGQTDERVKFISRGRGYGLFLTGDEAVLNISGKGAGPRIHVPLARRQPPLPSRQLLATPDFGFGSPDMGLTKKDDGPQIPGSVVRLRLVGANPNAAVAGEGKLPGTTNYFIGNDPKQWRTNVPVYARVKYQGVYPGVDLAYYGNPGGQLEYDFVVAPGANPQAIALAVEVQHQNRDSKSENRNSLARAPLRIAEDGDLVIPTEGGEVRLRKPVVYQERSVRQPAGSQQSVVNKPQFTNNASIPLSDNRQFLDGRFVLLAENRIGFAVPVYDRTRPLVIDPVLAYSTYLGGSDYDYAYGIAVEASGSAYVTGETFSTDFPTTNRPQAGNHGDFDAFVTKLDVAGSALVYSTYLGGSSTDGSLGIAVDSSGNASVTGFTVSLDFPTVNPLQPKNKAAAAQSGTSTAFVAKLNPTGSAPVYSTYLGGSGGEIAYGIAVDSSGNAYLTGGSGSPDFPTTNPPQTPPGGVFVTKLNPAGSALVYSTRLGGSSAEAGAGIAVDSSGNAYVTGTTQSTDFPTVNPLQATNNALYETAFVAKLNSMGSALVYSTYLGGSLLDTGSHIAVDSFGNAYVTGATQSIDFPTANPLQPSLGEGNGAAFVAKLNSAGSALDYCTYLGGSSLDDGTGIAVDSSGNAYVTGSTWSADFPTVNPFQANCRSCTGTRDAFVTKFDPAGSGLVYSTFLGGSGEDGGFGIAVDSSGNAYVTGSTRSIDFPVVNPFQTTLNGGGDAFVAKISPTGAAPSVIISPASLTYGPQEVGAPSAPSTVSVTNSGTSDLTIATITMGGANASDFATSDDTCTAVMLAPNGTCTVSVTFTPSATGTCNALLIFSDDAIDSPQTLAITGWGGITVPVADVSPSSLNFGNQLQFTQSEFQPVTLSNTGDATLTITSIATSHNFGFIWCGPSVAAGDSCTINVFFAPIATGPITGTLTIIDDSDGLAGSKQIVALSGTGHGFRLTAAPGSPTSATIAPGQSATYYLSAVGEGGFNESVNFTCTGAPAGATCTVSPNPVTVGSSPTNVTVTVKTTAPSVTAPRSRPLPPVPPLLAGLRNVLILALAFAAMAWAAGRRNQRGLSRWHSAILPLAAGSLLALAGCGGSGGGGGGGTHDPGTPAGTYSLEVTGTAGTILNHQIRRVTLTLTVT